MYLQTLCHHSRKEYTPSYHNSYLRKLFRSHIPRTHYDILWWILWELNGVYHLTTTFRYKLGKHHLVLTHDKNVKELALALDFKQHTSECKLNCWIAGSLSHLQGGERGWGEETPTQREAPIDIPPRNRALTGTIHSLHVFWCCTRVSGA